MAADDHDAPHGVRQIVRWALALNIVQVARADRVDVRQIRIHVDPRGLTWVFGGAALLLGGLTAVIQADGAPRDLVAGMLLLLVGLTVAVRGLFRRAPDFGEVHLAGIRAAVAVSQQWLSHNVLQQMLTSVTHAEDSPGPADIAFASVSLTWRSPPNRNGRLARVHDYWLSSGGRLQILGDAGGGKTLLARTLVMDLLATRGTGPVPVWLDAPRLSFGDTSLDGDDEPGLKAAVETWIADAVVQAVGGRGARCLPAEAEALLRSGGLVLVIDGLDEMDPASAPHPTRAAALLRVLNGGLTEAGRVRLILTGRTGTLQRLAAGGDHRDPVLLQDADTIAVQALRPEQIIEYIGARYSPERWQAVTDRIAEDPDGLLAGYLSSPWRLYLACAAYELGDADPGALLGIAAGKDEAIEAELLERYLRSTVRRHPRAKGGWYELETVRGWLHTLAAQIEEAPVTGDRRIDRAWLAPSDIALHTIWPIAGVLRVRLWHVTVHLSAIALLAAALLAAAGHGGRTDVKRGWAIAAVAVLVVWGIWLAWRFWPPRSYAAAARPMLAWLPTERPQEARSNSLRERRGAGRWLAGLEVGLAIGGGTGTICYLLFGPLPALVVGGLAGLAMGGGMERYVGLDRSLTGTFHLRGYWENDLMLSGCLSAAGFAFFPLVLGESAYAGLAFGAVLGFAGAFALSLVAWLRYVVAMTIMQSGSRLPWRLAAFLYWAYGAGLLRISGVGYQFRHQRMQSWLAGGAGRGPQ